ncbi:MFS transporter [Chloroflexota bacterium]
MRKENRGITYKWISVIVVIIGTLMTSLDVGIIRIVLPYFSEIFQVDSNTVLWLSLIFLLTSACLMLTLGRIGDTFGRKRLFTAGLIVFSMGLGVSSIAQSFTQLLIYSTIQAVGSAMIISNGNAIVTASFPTEERGKALGIIGAAVGVGLLSGPALGGVLLDIFDWRAIYYLRLPIGIIGAIMAWTLLKEPPVSKRNNKFDFIGAATIFITMSCLLLSINRGQSLGWTSPLIISLGVACIISFTVSIFVENRVPQPVVDLSLFRIRLFRAASVSHILNFMGTASVNFLMPFFLIQGLGFSNSKSGLILIAIPAVYIIVAPIAGRLSDKLGTLSLCTFGLTLISFGMFLLRGIGDDTSVFNIIWRFFVIGTGLALFDIPNSSAIMGSAPKERLGTASAMVATLRHIGMSIGTAIAGTAFTSNRLSYAAQLSSRGLAEEAIKVLSTISGFHTAILVTMLFPATGVVISLLRGRRTT